MRKIKFRGKDYDGNWHYGYYAEKGEKSVICEPTLDTQCSIPNYYYLTDIEVVPETVGQYTGLKDKNGKEVYHNDSVKDKHGIIFRVDSRNIYKTLFISGDIGYCPDDFLSEIPFVLSVEVIGNIFEK